MSYLRLAALLASAVAGGVAIGRSVARRAVDERRDAAIEEAAREARLQIRGEARRIAGDMLRRFTISTLVKAALVATLCAVRALGWLEAGLFSGLFLALIAAFLIRDAWVAYPTARLIWPELRRHGFDARAALREHMAARVLAEAMRRVGRAPPPEGWLERIALLLDGRGRDAIGREVAETVARIAGEISWSEVRPIARSAALKMGLGSLAYGAFVWLLIALSA